MMSIGLGELLVIAVILALLVLGGSAAGLYWLLRK